LIFVISDLASATVLECINRRIPLTVAMTKENNYGLNNIPRNLLTNIHYFEWDVFDSIYRVFTDIDTVFLAPDHCLSNIHQCEIILDAAKNSQVQWIVKCNSGSLKSEKLTEFNIRMNYLEKSLMECGKGWSIIRYSISPDEFTNHFKEHLLENKVISVPYFTCTWPALIDICSFLIKVFLDPEEYTDKELILSGDCVASTVDLFTELQNYVENEILWQKIDQPTNEFLQGVAEGSQVDLPNGLLVRCFQQPTLSLSNWCKQYATQLVQKKE